ncbi:MAG: CPBP family intramembrane metalloprotease [Gemmatimonadetes bacterium]|nr:CPBP family intramembrane metalloprotease [Gemmatimonadota bacterium]
MPGLHLFPGAGTALPVHHAGRGCCSRPGLPAGARGTAGQLAGGRVPVIACGRSLCPGGDHDALQPPGGARAGRTGRAARRGRGVRRLPLRHRRGRWPAAGRDGRTGGPRRLPCHGRRLAESLGPAVNSKRGLLLLLLLGSAVVWAASAELKWPVRLVTVLLLVPLPAALVIQARLLGDPAGLPRLSIYASSGATQLFLAAVAVFAALAGGFRPYALGLAVPVGWGTQLAWAAGVTALATVLNLVSERLGIRESALLFHLLPRTRTEKGAFVALSLTAGVCEEIVFRGFLITAVTAASGSLALALLISSLAFGVVHAYQEPSGVARATLLGLVLAAPFVLTGSLAASMLAHATIDLVGGFWLGPRLLR